MITVKHHSDPSFDASGAWINALKAAELNGDTEIFFPRGVYHFYSETKLKHTFISNNDDSVKRIVFYLSGKKNLKIYGDDAKFIFHGRLLPFLLEESQNITISGISIDFATAFHFETQLVETDGKSSLLRVPEKWHLEDGRLIVFDDGLDAIHIAFGDLHALVLGFKDTAGGEVGAVLRFPIVIQREHQCGSIGEDVTAGHKAGVEFCTKEVGESGKDVQTGGGGVYNNGIHVLQHTAPDNQAGVVTGEVVP
jgi:hypothetical protein